MKIIEISTRRRVTIAMFTLAVLLFGFVSFLRLKINLLPDLSYPTLTVRTEYTGAAPAEIENLISKPVEEAVGIVKNVQRVSSISRSGQSDVVLEFAWGTNMDFARLNVREKIDALELPLEVDRPTILRFDPSLDPIVRFGFYKKKASDPKAKFASVQSTDSDDYNENDLMFLRRFADEQIKKELESAEGVAAVKVSGGLEDEIQVSIDQARLAKLNIPVESLVQQLAAENVNLSGGRLEEGTQQFLVRTLNQFKSVDEINDVIISYKNNTPVYLRDVAQIKHGFKERKSITRINGLEAVEIAIYKEGDANTVSVARGIESRLKRVRSILPAQYELVMFYDQSKFISQAVNEVIQAAVIGGILAVIILYFFLQNFWTTVIISLSIPVSVIATFNIMYGADLSLNIMSLGGIALGIGMLLDNSIVVLESISRHKEKGKSAIESARDGASEVSTAVVASTLTTVAVFFPLVFVQGISGQLFRDQALTVTFSLLASLVVAITLIPMLASFEGKKFVEGEESTEKKLPKTRFGRGLRHVNRFLFTTIPTKIIWLIIRLIKGISFLTKMIIKPSLKIFAIVYGSVERSYPAVLKWSLNHKISVIGLSLILFVLSIFAVPFLGIELIPQLSQGEFKVEFMLPPGTPLEKTDAIISTVQRSSAHMPNITNLFSVAGSGNRLDANPERGGENWGELNVLMNDNSTKGNEESAMLEFREKLKNIPGLEYKFSRPTLFTFKTPIEIEISGFDLKKLKLVSGEIANRLEANDRFTDVKSTMEGGYPEVQIYFDREKAASLGLPVYSIANRVVNKVRGEVASKYSWHDRKIDILVRAREEDRASVEHIRKLIVNPESSKPIPLEAVADIRIDTGPSEIRRIDQERVALVTTNLKYGDLGTAAAEIEHIIGNVPIPSNMDVIIGGQNKEMSVSFKSLQFALLLAIFLVYLVMASLFESFLHPFIIIFTIPLAIIGAVFALLVTGSTISVVVLIGVILLVGIVVNNAIVLIDLINKLREDGIERTQAIMQAAKTRLRPIVMTTITTTLAMIPLAMGIGEGAEVRAPMGITVIGGLTVSTLLTLLVIPVVYSIVDRKQYKKI